MIIVCEQDKSGNLKEKQKKLNASAQVYAGFTEIVPWTKAKLMKTEFYKK